MSEIRIVIADDHPVVREGVAAMLSAEPGLRVEAVAPSGEALLALVSSLHPQIALVDLQMPGMGGISAIKELLRVSPETRVIVLSVCAGDEDVRRAEQAGASAYLQKSTARETIVATIRSVLTGKRPIESALSAGPWAEHPAGLTDRETEILQMVARGLRNREIGRVLCVTEGTVKTHVVNILAKLHVTDRTEAVTTAIQRGIIHLDS